MASGAGSNLASVIQELDAPELDGYVSDSRFAPGFGEDGVSKDVSNIVVVDNLPSVPAAKFDKLHKFIVKIYTDIVAADPGAKARAGDDLEGAVAVTMPKNAETGLTEGFAFVEFRHKQDAELAIKHTDKWPFDASHTLSVMRYDTFQQYRDEPDEFEAPERVAWQAQHDRFYWMTDEHSRDEFCIRYSNSEKAPGPGEREKHETEVLYAEARGPPALDYGGEKQKFMNLQWSASRVVWSPQGSYLVTMHPLGAKLWSGKGFREGLRLQHQAVNDVLWSPDERFVATWNGRPYQQGDAVQVNPREALIVWDARTGVRIRAFPQKRVQMGEVDFSWSSDSRFLARVEVDNDTNQELIRIYEEPNFTLLDNRSVKAQGARDLVWSPKRAPLLAYWTPERDATPTTVYVMKLPSKEFVRIRPLQQVESLHMEWHPQGDFLAVVTEKLTKAQVRKKKVAEKGAGGGGGGGGGGGAGGAGGAGGGAGGGMGATTKAQSAGYSVELYRTRMKDVPIEVLDVKDRVTAFAWEPHGQRFAMLLGEGPSKYAVALYQLPEAKGAPVLLYTLEDREVNTLHWAPRGEFLVLAGLQSNQGRLEFFDVTNQRTLNVVSHDVANGLVWDPSGRVVATTKTQDVTGPRLTRDTVANGYILWTFQGVKIFEAAKPKLFQFLWRPRVEGLLADDESRGIAKNLKTYVARYQQQDKQRQARSALLARLRKRKARDEFRAFLAERAAEYDANRPFRIEMGIEREEPDSVVVFEEVYENAVSEVVTVVA